MRKAIRDAIEAELKSAEAVAGVADSENRNLSPEEMATIKGHFEKARNLKNGADATSTLVSEMKSWTSGLGLDAPESKDPNTVFHARTDTKDGNQKRRSLGEHFTNAPAYTDLIKGVPNGQFSEKARIHGKPAYYKDLFTGADHDTSAGALVRPDYRGLLDPFYQRPLTVRSLVTNGSTTSDSIEFVRLVSVTNNAAVVPEATTTAAIDGVTVTDALGGLKPESGFVFEKDSTTVKTIAHWLPATRRALSDAAQIRTMIDEFLRYGLEEALEDEMLSGDGTGENFLGLANTPGVQTQTFPVGDQDVFDVLRIARRKVQIGGRANPTGYVMNPIDWEAIELMRNANGDFYGAGPFAMSGPRVWGLPVVQSEAIPAGTAYVGAWNWAVLYDREQASVQVTDSHADFFVRNLIAILAEMRAAFAVLRPPAFVEIDLAA